MFYVSKDSLKSAARAFEIFGKQKLYMELVVGTVIIGISPLGKVVEIYRAGQIYGEPRFLPVNETFSSWQFIYHPFKMSKLSRKSPFDRQCLYCLLLKQFDTLRNE